MSDSFVAIMAPYGSVGAAQKDFDALVRLVKDKQVRTEGLILPEGKDGKLYYFPDDITDKAVEWLHAVRAEARDA